MFTNTGKISLILQLTKRQIIGRYKGSSLGFLWSFLNPIILLCIYTFAFSYVFKAKWGLENENHYDFALVLFASLTVFNVFADVLREAPNLIINQANFVKKVIFPLEILPIVSVLSSLVHAFASFLVYMVFFLAVHFTLPPTILFLPLILFPLVLISVGTSYFLSSAGVFFRDIGHFMSHFVTILLFTSPVFFSVDRIPESFRTLLNFNPLVFHLEAARSVLVFGKVPTWSGLVFYFFFGLGFSVFGWLWFQRTKKAFPDYL